MKIENITTTKRQIPIRVWEINEINLIFTQYGAHTKKVIENVTIKMIVFNFIVKANGHLSLNAEIYAD